MTIQYFKSLDEVYSPHPNQHLFGVLDTASGEVRPKTIEDHYAAIERVSLLRHVPETIRVSFDTARNLFLYSWFVWRLLPVASLYAYITLEYALGIRARGSMSSDETAPRGLGPLLELALSRQWVVVEELSQYRRIDRAQKQALERWRSIFEEEELVLNWAPQVNPDSYARQISQAIPALRNELAHGTEYLSPSALSTLELCRDMILQLFPEHT